MTIVDLTAPTPFTPWGNRKFYLVPAISSLASPTRTELNASTNLTPQVTEYSGFGQTGTTVTSQSFVGAALKLAGPSELQDSDMTFRMSKTGTDIRDLLDFGDSVNIVIFPEGDTAGRTMDAFQVQVIGDPASTGITDPATIQYQFAVFAAQFRITVP